MSLLTLLALVLPLAALAGAVVRTVHRDGSGPRPMADSHRPWWDGTTVAP